MSRDFSGMLKSWLKRLRNSDLRHRSGLRQRENETKHGVKTSGLHMAAMEIPVTTRAETWLQSEGILSSDCCVTTMKANTMLRQIFFKKVQKAFINRFKGNVDGKVTTAEERKKNRAFRPINSALLYMKLLHFRKR